MVFNSINKVVFAPKRFFGTIPRLLVRIIRSVLGERMSAHMIDIFTVSRNIVASMLPFDQV